MVDELVFKSSLPPVSLEKPTREGLETEVAAMRDDVSTVPSLADIVADADEMTAAKGDMADLIQRGYAVSEALVERIELLTNAALEANAERSFERVSATPAQRQGMEDARVRLLDIRTRLSALGAAAGLPPQHRALGR